MTTGEMHTTGVMAIMLIIFAVLYDKWVGKLERQGYEGYTAFLVIGGTAVVLIAGVAVIGLEPILKLLVLFAAAGLPMTIGHVARITQQRRKDEQLARKAAWEMLDDGEESGRVCNASGNDAG